MTADSSFKNLFMGKPTIRFSRPCVKVIIIQSCQLIRSSLDRLIQRAVGMATVEQQARTVRFARYPTTTLRAQHSEVNAL